MIYNRKTLPQILKLCCFLIFAASAAFGQPKSVTSEMISGSALSTIAFKSASLSPPRAVYPVNGMVDIPIVPLFVVGTVNGADRYEMQLSTDATFNSYFSYSYWQFDSPTGTDSAIEWYPAIVNADDFKNNTEYFWRVRASANGGTDVSPWSSASHYTTKSAGSSLSQPQLSQPNNSATVPWIDVALRWIQVNQAKLYQVQWSTSSTLNGFSYQWSNVDSFRILYELKPLQTYYWRVVALNDNSISRFSPIFIFQTGNQVTITNDARTFTDGSGADDYENNLDLFWLIKPIGATRVTLSFSSFDTEANYDFVTVYDGPTISSPILGKFSGNSIPPTVKSTQGSMLVEFTSDWSYTAAGWKASYTSNANPSPASVSDEARLLGQDYRIPTDVILSIICKESAEWKQFQLDGSPVVGPTGDIGIMQININKPAIPMNVDSVKNYWKYNMEIGCKILKNEKFLPSVANTSSPYDTENDIDPSIIENWYYAIAWYNGSGDDAYAYVGTVWRYLSSPPTIAIPYFSGVPSIGNPRILQGFPTTIYDKIPYPPQPSGWWATATPTELYTHGAYTLLLLAQNGQKIHQWDWSTSTIRDITTKILTGSTSVLIQNQDIPKDFSLSQNYPNPFNPSTQISFDLPKESHVRLSVFSVLGQEVATLANETMQPGSHQVEFAGDKLPSGMYFYKIEAEGPSTSSGRRFVTTKKMLLLR